MVVLQIDADGIGAIPAKGDPPVAGNPDRSSRDALQRVPVESRQVQLLGPGRGIERTQHAPGPRDIRHAQPSRVALLEIPLEHPVAETAYHRRKRDAANGKRQALLYGGPLVLQVSLCG
jgi:hypothetical protein